VKPTPEPRKLGLAERLAELVSFDTQNPDGDEGPLVRRLAEELRALGAAAVDEVAVGEHAYVYARFGAAPELLLNAHVDTVPANTGYSSPPHLLVRRGSRLHGLGACDTKGAIAAILDALAALTPEARARLNVGVLFSGDEEKAGTCIRAFLDSDAARGLERAIVCEPTGCRVGVRHRGICAATATVVGPGGHSSRVDELVNPIAVLARAAVALDEWGASKRGEGPRGFEGLCLNVAALDGGLAFNVVPTRATLKLSLRPAPGADGAALLAEAERRARAAVAPHALEWAVEIDSPPFATRDLAAFAPALGDAAASPLDLGFWTEAARLSEMGIDAVVYGPGRVEEAHAADEHVEVAELEAARALFARALETTVK
jgi:acetylornithine deacetylase